MKTIIVALVTAALVLGVLNSELTPWRIVRESEVRSINSPVRSERRAAAPPDRPATDRSGDWMRDPNYRTSLEKTTLIGRPEPAASRDAHQKP